MTASWLLGAIVGTFLALFGIAGLWTAVLILAVALVLLMLAWIAHDEMRRARASADAEARTIFEEALRHAQDRAGKS
jgi:hypothetical protein